MPPHAYEANAPPVPVLAWRDPAAARGSAPLAPLATQVIIVYSIYIYIGLALYVQ